MQKYVSYSFCANTCRNQGYTHLPFYFVLLEEQKAKHDGTVMDKLKYTIQVHIMVFWAVAPRSLSAYINIAEEHVVSVSRLQVSNPTRFK
jgi:hypothetical protein